MQKYSLSHFPCGIESGLSINIAFAPPCECGHVEVSPTTSTTCLPPDDHLSTTYFAPLSTPPCVANLPSVDRLLCSEFILSRGDSIPPSAFVFISGLNSRSCSWKKREFPDAWCLDLQVDKNSFCLRGFGRDALREPEINSFFLSDTPSKNFDMTSRPPPPTHLWTVGMRSLHFFTLKTVSKSLQGRNGSGLRESHQFDFFI